MAYRPTSLDFINRPNPVEPHTDPHKHPLHADQSHLRLLHDTNNVAPSASSQEPPRKRRKSGEAPAPAIARPTLPAVRQQSEKRLRIPPTLSGLHQPPPDAGILPSIFVDGLRSVEVPDRGVTLSRKDEHSKSSAAEEPAAASSSIHLPKYHHTDHVGSTGDADAEASAKSSKSRQNKKWTDSETECLLKGVEKHGIGKWTTILKDPHLHFDERRSALDLKDRFRVCCPDYYKKKQTAQPSDMTSEDGPGSGPQTDSASGTKKKCRRTTHRRTEADLRNIGIETSFAQSDRRKRTAYSQAEDDAILRGFRKYGKKWSQIQQDESLGLASRTPTDLRDRMRNRWPEEYEKSGLKLGFPNIKNKPAGQSGKAANDAQGPKIPGQTEVGSTPNPRVETLSDRTASVNQQTQKEDRQLSHRVAPVSKTSAPFLSQADDVFWGLPLDADEERITLDRRILDWPADTNRKGAMNNADFVPGVQVPRRNPPPAAAPLPASAQLAGSGTGTLPSLAAVTAGSMPFDFGEQLELPSLLEGFGVLDGEAEDGRSGAQLMPSLDEILG